MEYLSFYADYAAIGLVVALMCSYGFLCCNERQLLSPLSYIKEAKFIITIFPIVPIVLLLGIDIGVTLAFILFA